MSEPAPADVRRAALFVESALKLIGRGGDTEGGPTAFTEGLELELHLAGIHDPVAATIIRRLVTAITVLAGVGWLVQNKNQAADLPTKPLTTITDLVIDALRAMDGPAA